MIDSLRPVDLVPRLGTASVRDVLAHGVGFPTPEKIDRVAHRYAADPALHLLGFERDGTLCGIIGFEIVEPTRAVIHNVAVIPDLRRQGIGRAMIETLRTSWGLTHLAAETDHEAGGFYEICGFQIASLGELYPGVERFRCVLDPDK